MASALDLGIIIVNYNVCALLRRCLQTVFASDGDLRFKVVVVDNQSGDDSLAMVRQEFPQVEIIANDFNAGYPAANNQGLRLLGVDKADDRVSSLDEALQPRYCLLLNPDTEVEPDTIPTLIRFLDETPNVGVVGPRLMLPNGELDHACRRGFPTPQASFYYMFGLSRLFPGSRYSRYDLKHLDIHQQMDVDSVTGAFMLVRTTAIREVGLLDDRFWMYGEDLDWAKRIKDAGWRVVYNPVVTALHVKDQSARQNPRARLEFYRAMPIFYYKHYRKQTPFWLHIMVLAGILLKGGWPLWPTIRAGSAVLQK